MQGTCERHEYFNFHVDRTSRSWDPHAWFWYRKMKKNVILCHHQIPIQSNEPNFQHFCQVSSTSVPQWPRFKPKERKKTQTQTEKQTERQTYIWWKESQPDWHYKATVSCLAQLSQEMAGSVRIEMGDRIIMLISGVSLLDETSNRGPWGCSCGHSMNFTFGLIQSNFWNFQIYTYLLSQSHRLMKGDMSHCPPIFNDKTWNFTMNFICKVTIRAYRHIHVSLF